MFPQTPVPPQAPGVPCSGLKAGYNTKRDARNARVAFPLELTSSGPRSVAMAVNFRWLTQFGVYTATPWAFLIVVG